MKRICTYLYLYIIAAAALVACDDSGKYITEPTLDKVQFGVTAEVPDSRTALTQGEDGIYRAIWKSGDNIRIAQIADSSAVEYSDHILTEDAEKVEIIASFSQSSASQFTYVLASPSVVVNEDFNTLSLTLPAEQTPSALETFDGNADILISDALNLEAQPTGQSIDFAVNRLSAVGKMTITNLALTDGDKVTSVTFTASQPLAGTIKNIYTSNLVAGKLQTTDFTFTDSSNSVKVNLPQAQSGSFTYFMCCLPTTLSTGEQYTVTVRTEQGRYTKSATIPTPLEFIEGQITSCTINMSGIALDTTPEDETTTYNIGDLVTINGTKGVVFQTTPNIKIVSAEEASLQWGSMGVLGVQTGAISTTDGAYNMSIIKAISDYENNYPAFKWCADLGEDWYLPSYDELFVMDNDLSVVNKTLTDNGFSALASQESVYWSSSEYVDSSNNYAHNVNLSTGVMNIAAKNTTARVRAVLAIGDNPADVDLSLYTDLSAEGTANCYLVQVAGNYKFKAVKGNSTESVGAAQSAKVLWETFGTDVTPNVGDLVVDAGYKDDYIYFSTNATFNNGNASIAVYDANGTILWSWHIWYSAEGWSDHVYKNNAVTMMDRNLGATSATPGSVGALGLLYQWGRKDPFMGSSSISTNTDAASTITFPSAVTSTSAKGTIEYAMSNPTTFISSNSYNYDWYYTGDSTTDNTRWLESEKTMYDPCPVGYRVPKGGESGFWATALGTSSSTSEGTTWDDTNKGRHWPLADGTTAWYPAVGYSNNGSGALNNVGSRGYYWSASPYPSNSYNAYYLHFYNGDVNPASSCNRGFGQSVRCVRDIEVVPEPDDPATNQILYTSTDGNVVTPYATNVFGANIVSNTYENGQGVITFNGKVTQIGSSAFRNCTSLASITIPDSVTEIGGSSAFRDCTNLASITIPDSVTNIESYAFYNCSNLKDVYYTGDISAWCKISFEDYYANPLFYGAKLYIDNKEVTEVTIPSDVTEIKDYAFYKYSSLASVTISDSVTTIGRYAFSGCSGLTAVTIGNGVTEIGNSTFWGCTSLASITIPDSVTSIGSSAFYNCSSITSVTIGNGVTEIKEDTFENCSSLTSITIGKGITSIDYAFIGCTSLKDVYYTGDISTWCKISFKSHSANPLYYGAKLYIDNKEVTEVTIPSDVTEIKDYAFYKCSSLTSVTIPDSVTKIGSSAFYSCSGLTSVTIGNGVTEIGNHAFDGCGRLTAVTIGNGVTSIGSSAFGDCTSLASITIPDSVTTIEGYTFSGCSRLTSVTIGNRVTEIGRYAFSGCSSLASVTIPDSVTSIGNHAFYNCSGLTSVTIGNSVTTIGSSAFGDCSRLTSVTIGNSVTTIGSYAFGDCSRLKDVYYTGDISAWCKISFDSDTANPLYCGAKLYIDNKEVTEVTIPSDVAEIKDYAFYKCSSLTSVTISDSVTKIGSSAFRGCTNLASITIPDSVTNIGSYAFYNCSNLKDVYYTGDISAWCKISFDNLNAHPLYYGAKLYIDNKEVTEVTIPSDVAEIKDYAFYQCSSLASVAISDSVTKIGRYAFSGCSGLTSVTIGNGVTSIGSYAFYSCSGLTAVTIGNGVTSIGESAFKGCISLASVTIPDGVLEIKSYAFENCSSLVSVYCKPTTPPILGTRAFNKNAADRKIYVPTASVDTYKTVSDWSDYVDAIVGY